MASEEEDPHARRVLPRRDIAHQGEGPVGVLAQIVAPEGLRKGQKQVERLMDVKMMLQVEACAAERGIGARRHLFPRFSVRVVALDAERQRQRHPGLAPTFSRRHGSIPCVSGQKSSTDAAGV